MAIKSSPLRANPAGSSATSWGGDGVKAEARSIICLVEWLEALSRLSSAVEKALASCGACRLGCRASM